MRSKRKLIKHLAKKPPIKTKVKKMIIHFDWGANRAAHRYHQLQNDRYDAVDLLQELVNESNYDGQVDTSQTHLTRILKTDHDSLNFDLLSLDRLGLIQVDVTALAQHHDHFTCKLIPHKIF